MMPARNVLAISFAFLLLCLTAAHAEWKQREVTSEGSLKNLLDVNGVLFAGNAAWIRRSTDFGVTWEDFNNEFPEDGHLRDYFVSDGKNLYNMFYGFTYDALFRSEDQGKTWKQVLKTPKDTLGRVNGLKGRVVISSEKKDGYHVSTDGGNSFTYTKGFLVNGKATKIDLRSMVELQGAIFGAQNEGPLLVSTDGLKTFKTLAGPSGRGMVVCQAGEYLLVGEPEFDGSANKFKIHTSKDGGKTWNSARFDEEEGSNSLDSAVEHKGTLYITLYGKIGRSRDGGKTWQNISENLMPFQIDRGSHLAIRGNELGLQGSVYFFTRPAD